MQIQIKLFASLRNKVGKKELEMGISDQDQVSDVIKSLNLSAKDNFITMINGVHCKLDHELRDGDVLSIFPMIAGG
ncbi:MoaD/ThiS family protein [candidate division KSB1 bacterium]|nr:MoaD/ThiS family protein [candidate division KSB1 bacterium]